MKHSCGLYTVTVNDPPLYDSYGHANECKIKRGAIILRLDKVVHYVFYYKILTEYGGPFFIAANNLTYIL